MSLGAAARRRLSWDQLRHQLRQFGDVDRDPSRLSVESLHVYDAPDLIRLDIDVVTLPLVGYKDGQDVAWIVCDAFSSAPANTKDEVGRPSILGIFPKFGVRDRLAYKAWIRPQIARQSPTILLPCHGPPVKRPTWASS